MIGTATGLLFTAIAGALLLGAIVFFHELGHFLVAKACRVRVLVFSVGFGPRLFGFRIGDTDYRVSALPLGGYVRMFGDDITEEISDEDKRFSYLHKPIPMRMAIAAAGPVANFILPVALFFAFNLGTHDVPAPNVGTVLPSEPAASAGVLPGDRLVSVDGIPVETFADVQSHLEARPRQKVELVVKRGSETLTLDVTPRAVAGTDLLNPEKERGRVGIVTSTRLPRVHLATLTSRREANATVANAEDAKPEDAEDAKTENADDAKPAAPDGAEPTDAEDAKTEDATPVEQESKVASLVSTGDLVTKVGATPVATYLEFERAISAADMSTPLTLTLIPFDPSQPSAKPNAANAKEVVLPPARGLAGRSPSIGLVQQAVTRDELAFGATAKQIAATRLALLEEAKRIRRGRGLSTLEGTVRSVADLTTAAAAGLVPGDRIVSIDGHRLTHAGEISSRLNEASRGVHVVGVISGHAFAAPTVASADAGPAATPAADAKTTPSVAKSTGRRPGCVDDEPKPACVESLRIVVFRMLPSPTWGMEDFRVLGVEAATAYDAAPLVQKSVGVVEAFSMAFTQTGGLIRDTAIGIAKLVSGQFSCRSMGGPITIFSLAGQAADRGAADFVFLMAFISVNLGIVNLLPVPVLDGGHLVMFAIEGIRRKRMSLAMQERTLKVGLFLLGLLMVVALFNDVMRVF